MVGDVLPPPVAVHPCSKLEAPLIRYNITDLQRTTAEVKDNVGVGDNDRKGVSVFFRELRGIQMRRTMRRMVLLLGTLETATTGCGGFIVSSTSSLGGSMRRNLPVIDFKKYFTRLFK